MADNADRSQEEIKLLLRRLNPSASGGHKERVRRLERFRNYVSGGNQKGPISTPEFYDDDMPLLFLGSKAKSYDQDGQYDDVDLSSFYGLLEACGTPSTDHTNALKRSARNAMGLVKFLVLDYCEMLNGSRVELDKDPTTGEVELNVFAQGLCMCTAEDLRMMKLHLHMEGDSSDGKRSGAKEDACKVLVLILTRHLSKDGSTSEPLPLEDILPTASSRKAFNAWLKTCSSETQKQIKIQQSVAANAKAFADAPSTGLAAGSGAGGIEVSATASGEIVMEADRLGAAAGGGSSGSPTPRDSVANAEEQLDEMGINLFPKGDKRQNAGSSDAPTTWAASQLSSGTISLGKTKTLNSPDGTPKSADDEALAASERLRQDEERKRLIARDPLGLRGEDFDVVKAQQNRAELLRKQVAKFEHGDDTAVEGVAKIISTAARKKSLLGCVQKCNAAHSEEKEGDKGKEKSKTPTNPVAAMVAAEDGVVDGSIVSTDSDFDPLLFLTLVHGDSNFDMLQDGLERLNNQTDNQVFRLQNLVRDNFGLFLRCADGIDLFEGQKDPDAAWNKEMVMERLDKLDNLSGSCVSQAKHSFTSLLDNTTEVRKTQSALSVLRRIGPLLQAPTLMRQHLEAGRFQAAVKAYRRVLLIDDKCKVELLRHVKSKAEEAAREAQRDLEKTLGDSSVPISTLLDAIRDLGELIALHVPPDPNEKEKEKEKGEGKKESKRKAMVRNNPPALGCLLVQSSHFSKIVEKAIEKAEGSVTRITMKGGMGGGGDEADGSGVGSGNTGDTEDGGKSSKAAKEEKNRWRYDVLEARVAATVHSVGVAKTWLPRLIRIGVAAREVEKREADLRARRRANSYHMEKPSEKEKTTAFQVYANDVAPAVSHLVEHATFCALGCNNSGADGDLPMTFGESSDTNIQALLRAPLPPALSAKCATELAELVDIVFTFATSAGTLRPTEAEGERGDMLEGANDNSSYSDEFGVSGNSGLRREDPLDKCVTMAENAVVTAERRKCIYAFDACSRTCGMRASSGGIFDGEALHICVQKLAEELTRPMECANEIERGCQLVIRRCCEGLASYVRERGVTARLRAVAECANALSGRMLDVVQDVAFLTGGQAEAVEEMFSDDIESLEANLFDEFLVGVRRNVTACVRLGWVDEENGSKKGDNGDQLRPAVFPSYLSASLLAIVRCRAQVEKALGDAVRRSHDVTYQMIALTTAADSVVFGMCEEIDSKMKRRIGGKQADRLSSELQFIVNTLKAHLSEHAVAAANQCRDNLSSKPGLGGPGGGPDGLGAVEELERLGRVYVLCLGEL